MKHLYKLGIDQYTDKYYDINTTSAYLLSVFLKAYRVDPAALGESIGVSKRTAQRYIYNSYTQSLPSLNTIYNCLKHIAVSLEKFFAYVEFEKAQNKTALYELISNRHKIINQCGLELVKDSLDQIEDQMNMYTMQLITDVSQEYFSKKNEKKNKSV